MPLTDGTAELSLDAADQAAITMVEDYPKNLYQQEMKLHVLLAKAQKKYCGINAWVIAVMNSFVAHTCSVIECLKLLVARVHS